MSEDDEISTDEEDEARDLSLEIVKLLGGHSYGVSILALAMVAGGLQGKLLSVDRLAKSLAVFALMVAEEAEDAANDPR